MSSPRQRCTSSLRDTDKRAQLRELTRKAERKLLTTISAMRTTDVRECAASEALVLRVCQGFVGGKGPSRRMAT